MVNLIAAAKVHSETLSGKAQEHMNQAITVVDAHLQAFVSTGPKKAYLHIKQCQVRATRDTAKSILKYQLSELIDNPRQTQLAIIFVCEALGGQVLEGTEAPTELERRVQTHIDNAKK